MIIPEPIQNLITALERLPGIGPKSASRLAFYLLRAPAEISDSLAEALTDIKSKTGLCPICFNITVSGRGACEICDSDSRDPTTLCVVEDPLDVIAIEKIGIFKGKYHVLHGLLSPIEGVGPEDIKISPLIVRVKTTEIKEVIVATNPSMEGDATALFIQQQLQSTGSHEVRITRLARGLPVGGDLEYADQNTLLRALSGRQLMN